MFRHSCDDDIDAPTRDGRRRCSNCDGDDDDDDDDRDDDGGGDGHGHGHGHGHGDVHGDGHLASMVTLVSTGILLQPL